MIPLLLPSALVPWVPRLCSEIREVSQGLDMSCMVSERRHVVSTTDQEAVDFRKYIIEWLMINHPLDCLYAMKVTAASG